MLRGMLHLGGVGWSRQPYRFHGLKLGDGLVQALLDPAFVLEEAFDQF